MDLNEQPTKTGKRQLVLYDCPFCNKEHLVELYSKQTLALVNGQVVEYETNHFLCNESKYEENEFVSGAMLDYNLQKAKQALLEAEHTFPTGEAFLVWETESYCDYDVIFIARTKEEAIAFLENGNEAVYDRSEPKDKHGGSYAYLDRYVIDALPIGRFRQAF